MNQDQQPQRWWRLWWKWAKDNWLLLALVALAVGIATITILGYWLRLSWTGLVVIEDKDPTGAMQVKVVNEPRLFWDWLALLIIPVVLGAGALWFNQQARKNELKIADDQRQNELKIAEKQRQNELELADQQRKEDALQRYLGTMQGLILDKRLRRSKKDAEVRSVARARTLTVLRSLDGNRKGQVVRFLHEADLIGKVEEQSGERRVIEAIIDLQTADLSRADLNGADLSGADLYATDLINADLSVANLGRANLGGANLYNANLSVAYLSAADLINADLSVADLSRAGLGRADLTLADLSGTNLRGARNLTNQQLAQASSLVGATLPDGKKMTEEGWEEFKKQHRK